MRRLRGDEGAVAVIVGLLMATGVIMGFGVIVVDVGQIYAERRQLQNGADAAALAVAHTCAVGPCDVAIAPGYADSNANDAANSVYGPVCGEGGGLPACSGSPYPDNSLVDCAKVKPAGNYVQVRTTTRQSDGSPLLPGWLVRAMPGRADYLGTTVGACARAIWGGPKHGKALAVTFSECEWERATLDGTLYADPPEPDPPVVFERVLKLHTVSDTEHCSAGPSGSDTPGGFGWLDDGDVEDCETEIDEGGTYDTKTGVAVSGECRAALDDAIDNKSIVFIPIFNHVEGTGDTTEYTLVTMAGFIVTGYNLPGGGGPPKRPSYLLGSTADCTKDEKCIYGYFVEAEYTDSTAIPGGPDRGVTVVGLVQ